MKIPFRILFILAAGMLLMSACSKDPDDSGNQGNNSDSIGPFNEVIYAGNGWKSVWKIHDHNTAATGIQYFGLTECGLSIDNNNSLHFIVGNTKQSQQDAFTDYYISSANISTGATSYVPFTTYQNSSRYYFQPGTDRLLTSVSDNLISYPGFNYAVSHPLGYVYKSLPRLDESGNVLTFGTNTGTGTESFVYLRRSDSQFDSLYTIGDVSSILLGFFPAVMKNEGLYALVKQNKKLYALKPQPGSFYNERSSFQVISELECSGMQSDFGINYLAKLSPDHRYINYWLTESFSEPQTGWFFRFDCETETLTCIYNGIPLPKGHIADNSGKSSNAVIGDDGSLYVANFEEPNSSSSVFRIFKISGDGTASGPVMYKSDHLLKSDDAGNEYVAENLMYSHGKLFFTVRSGLLIGEDPQFDVIMEE